MSPIASTADDAHCVLCFRRCRLILVCESLSKVIPPLRSRCLPIRVAAPEVSEIKGILQHIAKKEDIILNDGQQRLAAWHRTSFLPSPSHPLLSLALSRLSPRPADGRGQRSEPPQSHPHARSLLSQTVASHSPRALTCSALSPITRRLTSSPLSFPSQSRDASGR
jgi:hypothetical protein